MNTSSHHFLIELNDVDISLLDNILEIESIMLNAVQESNATYVNHYFHKFNPQGVSGVVIIAESHLSIHTWPENGYAALDIFTCGDKSLGEALVRILSREFKAGNIYTQYIPRGPIISI